MLILHFLFILAHGIIYLLLHVNDIVIKGNEKGIFLSQAKYARLLTRVDMVDRRLISTLFVVVSHLIESGTTHSDATQFRSLIGAL